MKTIRFCIQKFYTPNKRYNIIQGSKLIVLKQKNLSNIPIHCKDIT